MYPTTPGKESRETMKIARIIVSVLWFGVIVFLVYVRWPMHHPSTPIPGHHWRCDSSSCELYDANGNETASIVGTAFGSGNAQACILDNDDPCKYFETNELAFSYMAEFYAKKAGKR